LCKWNRTGDRSASFLKFLPTNPFNLCCTDFFWGVDVKNVFETITGTKSNTHTSST